MQMIPRIYMDGKCQEAIELYKEAFGATVDQTMTYGNAKMGTEAQKDLILNSQIDMGGFKLHMADQLREEVKSGNQLSLTVVLDNEAQVRSAFEVLKAEGSVMLEPAPTFFSPCHCGVVDKFGVIWQINCTR